MDDRPHLALKGGAATGRTLATVTVLYPVDLAALARVELLADALAA